jgi:hypothetical protein
MREIGSHPIEPVFASFAGFKATDLVDIFAFWAPFKHWLQIARSFMATPPNLGGANFFGKIQTALRLRARPDVISSIGRLTACIESGEPDGHNHHCRHQYFYHSQALLTAIKPLTGISLASKMSKEGQIS